MSLLPETIRIMKNLGEQIEIAHSNHEKPVSPELLKEFEEKLDNAFHGDLDNFTTDEALREIVEKFPPDLKYFLKNQINNSKDGKRYKEIHYRNFFSEFQD